MLPSLFVSHGSPALMIMENETKNFLKSLPSTFDKPKYILVISAHWVTNDLKILYEDNPFTIYDFYNFPKELYELDYPAPSSKEKSDEIIKILKEKNIDIKKDELRGGYDHGVWAILKLMYPDANIPVLQISLPIIYDSKHLVNLGEVLSKLRDEILIIASGTMTHNLRDSIWDENNTYIKPYAKEFRDWIVDKVEKGDVNSLIEYRKKAPYLVQNHPSLEHFLPLFVSLGASKTKVGKSLNNVYMYGNQSMDTIIFKE
jgi:4,5-DOPA dioxygenase extradiol